MMTSDTAGPTETVVLDLTGVGCPFVLAEIVQALEEKSPDHLEVLSDCIGALRDTVPAFCAHRGYDVAMEQVDGPVYRMTLSKP